MFSVLSFKWRIPTARVQPSWELQEESCSQISHCLPPLPLASAQDLGSCARASWLAYCSLLIAGSADPWSCHSQSESASSLLFPNLTTFLMFSGDPTWKRSHGLITAVQRLSSPTEVLRKLKQNALKRWHCQAKQFTVVVLAQDDEFPHQHLRQLRNKRNDTSGPHFLLPFISFFSVEPRSSLNISVISICSLPSIFLRFHVEVMHQQNSQGGTFPHHIRSVQIISLP